MIRREWCSRPQEVVGKECGRPSVDMIGKWGLCSNSSIPTSSGRSEKIENK